MAALYGWNDPTGILLNVRGWALHDQWTGLIDRPRLPDIYAATRRPPEPIPMRTWEFLEIDKRVGWYAGASWDEIGIGHLDILYYNNQADPTSESEQYDQKPGRPSSGTSGSAPRSGRSRLLAQGMRGETYFEPSETFWSRTWFESAYLLAGWNISEFLAARRTRRGLLHQRRSHRYAASA